MKALEALTLGDRRVVPLQVGVIGRLTEVNLIPAGPGRMRIVSLREALEAAVQNRGAATCCIGFD